MKLSTSTRTDLSVAQAFRQAAIHHQAGRFQEAEQFYRAILQAVPQNPDANHNLGVLIMQTQNRPVSALPYFKTALDSAPLQTQFWISYIRTLILTGDTKIAQHVHAEGRLRGLQGPDVAALSQQMRASGAQISEPARKPISSSSRSIPSRAEEDALLEVFKRKDYPAVEKLAIALTKRFPKDGFGWKALGVALKNKGQSEHALEPMEKAVKLAAKDPETHNNLGTLLCELGMPARAEAAFRSAIKIKPTYAEAYFNLGNALMNLHRPSEAAIACRQALTIRPDYAKAHYGLANALKEQGKFYEAEVSYRQALALAPDDLNVRGGFLFCLNYAAHLSPQQRLAEAREYGKAVTQSVSAPFDTWSHDRLPTKLRVGLISGDLREHPVGYFLESLFAHFDYQKIELIAYATQPIQDDLSRRLKQSCSGWHSLMEVSDSAAAKAIHQDGVHILIDLAGHTAGNRLPVFAWRPAPIQVSWLGYFATTGVPAMNYLLADPTCVPPEGRDQFTETVWCLPETRLCFTPPEAAPAVSTLPALQRGHITFGSFQVLPKLGDQVLTAWGRILLALPQARLRLQIDSLADSVVRRTFEQRLKQCGVDTARVTLHPPMPRAAYLVAHAEIDLILDTFPYPGGTTTCEALWMGVPTLTLEGDSMLSRQGASLLKTVGLKDWIAVNVDDYIEKAITAAKNLPALSALRARLRDQMRASPLCDARRFARNMEATLWEMWKRHAEEANEQTCIKSH